MEKIRFQKYDRLIAIVHWIVLLLVLFYSQFPEIPHNKRVIYPLLLAGALFTLVYHHILPKKYAGPKKYLLEAFVDIAAITFLMWLAGGHLSFFFFLYFLVVAGLALFLGRRTTFLATLFITFSLLTLFSLEYALRMDYGYGTIAAELPEHLGHLAILISALWVVTFLSGRLAQITESALEEQAALTRKNKELYEKESRARQELATIEQTSATLLSNLNIDQVLKKIAEGLTAGVGYDRALIFLINKKEMTIEGKYASGLAQEALEKVKIPLSRREGLLFKTIWEAKTQLIEDFSNNSETKEEFKDVHPHLAAELAIVPIVSRLEQVECQALLKCNNMECPLYSGVSSAEIPLGEMVNNKQKMEQILNCSSYKVFGAILVDNYKCKRAITEENITSLQIFAKNAAIALENAVLYAKQRKDAKQISLINEVGRVITSSLKIEEIYSALVAVMKKIIPFDRVSISLLDDTGENVESYALTSAGKIIEKKKVKPKEVCCAEWVTKHKKPLLRPDLKQEPRFLDDNIIVSQGIKTCYSLPLMIKGEVIGTFCLYNKKKAAYAEEDLNILMPIAEQLAIAVENARLYEKTQHLAITDSLTDLYNHGYSQKFLARELARASRYQKSLSAVMLDIDDFKNYNDSYGHPQGDKVLIRLAQILKANVRDIDIAARYGGDEFILVLPETGATGAQIVAERVQKQVSQEEFLGRDQKKVHLTISAGVASYPSHARSAEDLIKMADDFLYGTKKVKQRSFTLP